MWMTASGSSARLKAQEGSLLWPERPRRLLDAVFETGDLGSEKRGDVYSGCGVDGVLLAEIL